MKKVTANIIKVVVGKLPLRKAAIREMGWYNSKVLKHQEDKKDKVFNFLGFIVNYRRPYELRHTFEELFTMEIYRFKANTDTPLIIDCGANIGLAVIYFKKLYPQARIIAFEPDAVNFELLEKNIVDNNLTNIDAQKAAVWVTGGSVAFASQASEASHITSDGSGEHTVKAIKLSDILLKENRIDFLKIDIEGAEWPVIKDCSTALNKVENLFLEYHGRTKETYKLADIFEILNKAGFAIYVQKAAENLQQPFIQKTSDSLYDVQLNIFCFRN